ncbi:hypothetical protein GQX74_014743 [Glossina fuscipes]|nr:hypothetical protein GQX74_014743 [Glossina fuscipes]
MAPILHQLQGNASNVATAAAHLASTLSSQGANNGMGSGGNSSQGPHSNNTSGSNNSNAANITTRQANTNSNMPHFAPGSTLIQTPMPPPNTSHTAFMTPTFMQLQQQSTAVMVAAAQYSTVAAAAAAAAGNHGNPGTGQGATALFPTPQQSQQTNNQHHQTAALHHAQQTLHYFHANAGATALTPAQSHLHHQQHQMRSIIPAAVHPRQHAPGTISIFPPNYFALQATALAPAPRTSLLTNVHQQTAAPSASAVHVAHQLPNATGRGAPAGPTTYVSPPYCTPPLQMGTAAGLPPQPSSLLATATSMTAPSLQGPFGHLGGPISASTSSTSLNIASGAGGNTSSSNAAGGEHLATKQRKHAIPIVNPITLEPLKFPEPQKKNTAVEVRSPISVTSDTGELSHGQKTTQTKDSDQSTNGITEVSPNATLVVTKVPSQGSKDKIDQQMQTDAVKDKSGSISSTTETTANVQDLIEEGLTLSKPQSEEISQTSVCGGGEQDDTDADTTELEDYPASTSQASGENVIKQKEIMNTMAINYEQLVTSSDELSENRLEGHSCNKNDDVKQPVVSVPVKDDVVIAAVDIDAGDRKQSKKKNCNAVDEVQEDIAELKSQQNSTSPTMMSSTDYKIAIEATTTSTTNNKHPNDSLKTTINNSKPNTQVRSEEKSSSHSNAATTNTKQKTGGNTSSALATARNKEEKTQKAANKSNAVNPIASNNSNRSNKHHATGGNKLTESANNSNNSSSGNSKSNQNSGTSNSLVLNLSGGGSNNGNNNNNNFITVARKNKKAPKRTKENQKQSQQQQHRSSNNNSNPNNNNNNNNSNNNNSGNNSNINNNNSYSKAALNTAGIVNIVLTDNVTNASFTSTAISGNNNNNDNNSGFSLKDSATSATLVSSSSKHQTQQRAATARAAGGGSGGQSKETDIKTDTENSNQQRKHTKTQEIVAQFLQPSILSEGSSGSELNSIKQEEQQLQFLNSSSSACEDEEERLQLLKQQQQFQQDQDYTDIRFGDFKEYEKLIDTRQTTSTGVTMLIGSKGHKHKTSANNNDTVDSTAGMKNYPLTHHRSSKSQNAHSHHSHSAVTVALESPKATIIKYNLEELKAFAKAPVARKPPVLELHKNNGGNECIMQLFVSRQQHHHLSHHGGHNMASIGLQQQQQQYQQMSFNESIEFVGNKRRQGRKHDHQMMRVNATAISNANAGAGGVSAAAAAAGSGNLGLQYPREKEIIRVHLSLNEEIKLSECENAWQPETLRSKSNNSVALALNPINEDIDTVLKRVRGVLNKLTPDNFEVLLKTMTNISMNTQEKMQQVMLLIFEKTVSEPNFAPTYAKFCKMLFQEIKHDSKTLFNSSLIKRIQHEFETNVNDADAKKVKLQPLVDKMDASNDAKEKLELQAEIEDQEYQFRRRAWGTVRFIGEMYKLQSLTSDRVLLCIESLLEHGSEEKLEYMCKLLTTVGHLLEGPGPDHCNSNARMDKIFIRMHDIVNKSRANVKAAIAATAASNQTKISYGGGNNSGNQRQSRLMSTDMRDSSVGGAAGGSGSGGNYFMQKQQKSQFMTQQEQSIDPKKLNFSRGDDTNQTNTKLGNSSIYIWRSHGVRQEREEKLSNYQTSSSGCIGTGSEDDEKCDNNQQQTFSAKDNQKLLNHLLEEVMGCSSIHNKAWHQEVLNTWRSTSKRQQISLMHYLLIDYLHLSAVKKAQRSACAAVFSYLLRTKALDQNVFGRAYEQFADEFPDLLVDVPNGWCYAFEFLGPMLHERLISFNDIWQQQWRDDRHFTERFLKALVIHFTREFGANYLRDLWHKEFKLDRGQLFFNDQQQWREFVKNNTLEFIYDCGHNPAPEMTALGTKAVNTNALVEQHVKRIECLLNDCNDCDLAIDYINTNVNINSQFIKTLTRFLCCDYATVMTSAIPSSNSSTSSNNSNSRRPNSDAGPQLNVELFRYKCIPLLRRCVDAQETFELCCLDAIIESLREYYDAQTADDMICNVFDLLYHDGEIISRDTFEKWYKTRRQISPGDSTTMMSSDQQKSQYSQGAGSNAVNRENLTPLSAHLHAYIQKLL